jgi:hypothetical protein
VIAAFQTGDSLRVALAVVDGFVALTAIGGGVALVLGLEATRFGPEWLEGTPFRSYLVPGLLLSLAVGGSAAVATVATIVGWHGGLLSALAGLVLVGWIVGEVAILNQPAPTRTEGVYFVAGLLVLALAAAFAWA